MTEKSHADRPVSVIPRSRRRRGNPYSGSTFVGNAKGTDCRAFRVAMTAQSNPFLRERRDGKPVPYTMSHRKTLIYNGSRARPRVGAAISRPRTFRFHDRKTTRRPSCFLSFRGAEGDVGISRRTHDRHQGEIATTPRLLAMTLQAAKPALPSGEGGRQAGRGLPQELCFICVTDENYERPLPSRLTPCHLPQRGRL